MNHRRKKVGLALIGVIKALQEHNIPIDYIAGTSMGAIIAAYYALNLDIAGIEKESLSFTKRELLNLVDLNRPGISMLKGDRLRHFLKKLYRNKKFRHTKIPLSVGVSVLEDGSKMTINSGRIVDAAMASSTFPGVFPPVRYKGKTLVDGGLTNATPIDLVREMGAEIIIAVDLFKVQKTGKAKYNRIWKVLERTYEIALSNLSQYGEEYTHNGNVVLIGIGGNKADTFAFHKAEKYIRLGEEEARKKIRKIKRMLK